MADSPAIHPAAAPQPTKPNAMKEQVYLDERPSEYFDHFYAYSQAHRPNWVYSVVRWLTVTYARAVNRIRGIDAHNVPAHGAVIIAPNHFSHVDHFYAGAALRRKLQFMAKSQLFTPPLEGVYMRGGTFPVRRGQRDPRAMDTSKIILERGGAMVMYCEGGRSRTGELATSAKRGIGQLALETGAPIVPTAILGSDGMRNWKRGEFPRVTVKYGKPLRFEVVPEPTREQAQAAADQIFAEVTALYGALREQGRKAALRAAR
jgi:1-acyl-sn-glycerol-3-phosphate acyltransferase